MSAYSRASNLAAYQTVATHGGVAASDPHGLILMLMDGALDRVGKARGVIGNGLIGEKGQLLSRATIIVGELRSSLDLSRGGEIATNLDSLYDYICRLIMQANADNRVEPLDEVIRLLNEIRSAWIAVPVEARASRATQR